MLDYIEVFLCIVALAYAGIVVVTATVNITVERVSKALKVVRDAAIEKAQKKFCAFCGNPFNGDANGRCKSCGGKQ
jgi:hypothetical protein